MECCRCQSDRHNSTPEQGAHRDTLARCTTHRRRPLRTRTSAARQARKLALPRAESCWRARREPPHGSAAAAGVLRTRALHALKVTGAASPTKSPHGPVRSPPTLLYSTPPQSRGGRDSRQRGRAAGQAVSDRAGRSRKPRARSREQRSAIALTRRPSDGRGPGIDPRPPYAFKMSMFNVFCNSH